MFVGVQKEEVRLKTKDILYIVMPAYNEEAKIRKTVEDFMNMLCYGLPNANEKSRIVVADSGSTDQTHSILLELKEKYGDRLVILSDTKKEHGPKLIAMYKYAIWHGADYIFQTDSDGQVPAYHMDHFWCCRHYRDAVLGWRNERQDGLGRVFAEKVVCFMLKLFFNASVPDANAPFRLMKCDLVKRYINQLPDDYFLPNIMLTAYFSHNKENISFHRIPFFSRKEGKNSIDMKKLVKIGVKSVFDFAEFRREMDVQEKKADKVIKKFCGRK